MPNWTDDDGVSWFGRCTECGNKENAEGDCTSVECIAYVSPRNKRLQEVKDFHKLMEFDSILCNIDMDPYDFDDLTFSDDGDF
jgi:hypothetical protein